MTAKTGDDGAAAREIVEGRFRIERELGRHGSAVKYLATDLASGRPVVVERFRLGAALPGESAALVEKRAKILVGLDHPGLPAFLDLFGRSEGPETVLDLVFAYAEGTSLSELVAAGRRFSEGEVRELLRGAAAVLAYLHRRRPPLVHRNVRPSNVILGDDGSVRLTDLEFLARPVSADPLVTFGVPWLISGCTPPEALRGEFTPASDVFSLGAVAITALTGREPPFLGVAPGWNAGMLLAGAPLLAPVVARMTAPDPAARYADASALARELEPPPSPPSPPSPRPRRGRVRAPLVRARARAAAEVLLLVVLVFIGAKRWKHTWDWLHPEISGPVITPALPPPPLPPPATPGAREDAGVRAGAVVEGRLHVERRPLDALTQAEPTFWFRNEERNVVERPEVRYAAGRYRVAGLPAGPVGMSVTVDLEPGNPVNYPGDLRAWTVMQVPATGALARDVALHRVLRLYSPADNASPVPGWGRPCGTGTIFRSPVPVSWEDLGAGAVYDVRVDRMDCRDGHRTVATAYAATTGDTAVEIPLSPPPEGTCYVLRIEARRNGELLGVLMTHGAGGTAWDLRFVVR